MKCRTRYPCHCPLLLGRNLLISELYHRAQVSIRHAMCCEQHCNALAYIRGEAIQSLLNALSQGLQKGGLHMPIPRDRQLQVITMQFGDGILERTHVALHDEW